MSDLACLDGNVLPVAEARIPVTDEGLLRGDGVFEVMRVYGGRPYALADHFVRMERSAANLRLPFDAAAMRADALALLDAAPPGAGEASPASTSRGVRRVPVIDARELPGPGPLTMAAAEAFRARVEAELAAE